MADRNNTNREIRHANSALNFLMQNDEMKRLLPQEKIREALLSDCRKNLVQFGPPFLRVLQNNQHLELTPMELQQLQDYVHSLPQWKDTLPTSS